MKKKDSEFYNRSIKLLLQNNGLEMYSTHSKWKSAVTERFISTLKSKYYDHMASVSKKSIWMIKWIIHFEVQTKLNFLVESQVQLLILR